MEVLDLPSADSIRCSCPLCGNGDIRSDAKSIWCGKNYCEWRREKSFSIMGTVPDHALRSEIARAAAETDANPTESQRESGNYRKGKVKLRNLTIAIENPKGSVRRGKDKLGNLWETTMNSHYGYIVRAGKEEPAPIPEPEKPLLAPIPAPVLDIDLYSKFRKMLEE